MDSDWEAVFASIPAPLLTYRGVADALEHAIVAGALRSGARLPTQREVARVLGVAIGTVTRAYSEIERRGLVVGKVGSGTYVSRYLDEREAGPSHSRDREAIDMTISRPPPQGATIHLANALRLLSKRHDVVELLGTEPPNGWPRHRIAASQWMQRRLREVRPGQIIMTNGVQHALTSIFAALTHAGDVVATEYLNYPGIRLLADLHRIRLIGVPMDESGLRADCLARLCEQESVKFVLCSPTAHNPTTVTMSAERRAELASLARKHDFLIVENDILGMLPSPSQPALRDLEPNRTVYVTGLSKVVAAGLRVGFIAASPSLLHSLMTGVRSTTWMPPPLMLEIFSLWVENGAMDEIAAWHREEIAARRALAMCAFVHGRLRSDSSCYHVWLELPDGWSSDAFVDAAYAHGVLLSPSDTFAIDDAQSIAAVRISLGAPNSRDDLARGLTVLSELLANPR